MKKSAWVFTILLLVAAVVSAADGPVDQGSLKLGGSVYFMTQWGELHEDENEHPYSAIDIAPSIGYFLLPGLMAGMDLGFYYGWQGEHDRTTGLYLGPSLTFYYRGSPDQGRVKGSVYPYLKGFFSYGQTKYKSLRSIWIMDEEYIEEVEDEVRERRFGGELGVLLMISNTVGLTVSGTLISKYVEWDYEALFGGTASRDGMIFMLGTGVTYFIY